MVAGSKIRNKATECMNTPMDSCSLVSSRTTRNTALDETTGQTAPGTKATTKMANSTARGRSSSCVTISNYSNTKANGSKVSKTVKVTRSTKAKEEKAFGRTETSSSGWTTTRMSMRSPIAQTCWLWTSLSRRLFQGDPA